MTADRFRRPFRAAVYRDLHLAQPIIAAGVGIGILGLPGAYPFWQPMLPIALSGALILLLITRRGGFTDWPSSRLLLWVLAGYLYGHWEIGEALEGRLPLCADASLRHFELEILDRPLLEDAEAGSAARIARFQGRVRVRAEEDCPLDEVYEVRMSWFDPPDIARGEHWQVEGRLRPPWGNRNPGGLDYERWLLGQSLAGTGYVRSGQRISAARTRDPRAGIRSRLADWVASRKAENAGVILALISGDDSMLDQSQWRRLRDSGTVHLLVVSGLHVGMVSGFLFLVGGLAGRTSTSLLLRFGARRFAGVFALLGSGVYVWISGAGVPAVRAWLMSSLVLVALIGGRAVRGLEIVGLVMAVLLLAEPLIVHQQGFWLSFAAVLALVAFFGPFRQVQRTTDPFRNTRVLGLLQGFLAVQIVLLVAMSPLLSTFQGGIPLQSPLINALVVPVVAFLALPLALLSALLLPFPLLVPLADRGLEWADALLSIVMGMIGTAATVPAVSMELDGVPEWLAMLLLLACLSRRSRLPTLAAGLALWWALLLPDGRTPRLPGEFRVTALDVGQGSAILVDTRRHRLIFDSGPRYPSGFDLGDAVVVPSYQRDRNQALSALVLSHDDLDHTGGAGAVIRQLKPERVWTSFPMSDEFSGPARRSCTSLSSWYWDEVKFEFLHPIPGWQGSDNDRSCVLLISNGERSALLAGDISRRVEARLKKRPLDLVMAPHHGSRTSSSPGFVHGFTPKVVFVSTDRRSRYGHPHPEVLRRYAGTDLYVTGRQGALRWSSRSPGRVIGWRRDRGAYWHRRLPRRLAGRCPACE